MMILRQLLCFVNLLLVCQAKYYSIDKNLHIAELSKEIADFALHDPKISGLAQYDDDREVNGWVRYYIKTAETDPDWLQTYVAGYMEGLLTYELIWDGWLNDQRVLADWNQDVKDFVQNQTNWMLGMINSNPEDSYWNLVNATLAISYGMYDGYLYAIDKAQRSDMNLTYEQFLILTYLSDLFDVMGKYNDGINLKPPSCSFLAKIANGNLYVSHTTWYDYVALLRVYKVLDLNLHNPLMQTKRMSYSAMVGSVASQDDYYMLDNNRLVTETSLLTDNPAVYDYLHYDSVPYWVRITVANFAFDDQETWTEMYFAYRSGTYNNQWLVIDFNNFNSSKNNLNQASDIIWMVEEFYSLTSVQDVTQELLVPQGYVASYNVPFTANIQTLSENPTNYTTDPRAILFKKYAPGIQTLNDFMYVMRLNNHSDTGDYCQAIASRCDLNSTTNFPNGAIDCKVTSDSLIPTQQAWIIAGPTHENLPYFTWDDWPQYNNSRNGIMTLSDFDWIFMDPNSNYSFSAPEHGKLAFEGYYAFIMEANANPF